MRQPGSFGTPAIFVTSHLLQRWFYICCAPLTVSLDRYVCASQLLLRNFRSHERRDLQHYWSLLSFTKTGPAVSIPDAARQCQAACVRGPSAEPEKASSSPKDATAATATKACRSQASSGLKEELLAECKASMAQRACQWKNSKQASTEALEGQSEPEIKS